MSANEVLMESFAADAEIVYPEEFAGSYIEDNKLVVEFPVMMNILWRSMKLY